jgi:hypothetical protein
MAGISLAAPLAAQASVADLAGEWGVSNNDHFLVAFDDAGIGTHTAGAAGCFGGSVSGFWRNMVETTPGVYTGQRLLGDVCGSGWVATRLTLSANEQQITEKISTGPTITYLRTTALLMGVWHAPAPEDDFSVEVLPDGTARHLTGDSECWGVSAPDPFWKNAVRTSSLTWNADRRLGNVCNDLWVTETMTLSPLADMITEQISTGAVRYLLRDAPSLAGDWHATTGPTFKATINADGTGDHTVGASECWSADPGQIWRAIVPTGPNTWHSERHLGNACNDRWVTAEITMAADGSTFTERLSTSAVRTWARD